MDNKSLIETTKNLYRLTLLFPKKEPLRYKARELADEILADSLRITCPPEPSAQADGRRANQYEYTNKTENRSPSILEHLEVLDSFFEVAKAQNWVSPGDLLAIQQEYSKIKEALNDIDREEPAFAPPSLKFLRASKATAGKKEASDTERIEGNEGQETVPQYPFFQDQEKITSVRSNAEPQAKRDVISPEAERISNGVNERQRRILEILKEKERVQVWEIRGVFPQVTKRTLRRDFEQMFKKGLIERIGEKNDTYYQLKPAISEEG